MKKRRRSKARSIGRTPRGRGAAKKARRAKKPVKKAAQARTRLQTRRKERRRRRVITASITLFVAFALIIAGSAYLVRLDKFRLEEIDVRGVEEVDADRVRAEMRNALMPKLSGFIPPDSFFAIRLKPIKQALLREIKELKEVRLLRKGFDALIVVVSEREPFIVACGDAPSKEEEACLYADSDGVLFEDTPNFDRSPYVTVVFEGALLHPGDDPFLEKEPSELVGGAEDVDEIGLTLQEVVIGESGGVTFTTREDTSLLFDRGASYSAALDRLKSIIETQGFGEGVALEDLDHIDLRLGSKIFFSLKGGA